MHNGPAYFIILLTVKASEKLEEFVFNLLYRFFNYFNLLNPSQYGFREKISISDVVTDCLQYIHDSMNENHIVDSLFLDYIKPFDCVNYSVYIYTESVHIYSALMWLQSYVMVREHYGSIHNFTSLLCNTNHIYCRSSFVCRK